MEDLGWPSVKVVTYNVFAAEYVRPQYFPRVAAEDLAVETRYPRIIGRVAGLEADILCLQEVDRRLFGMLQSQLEPAYTGLWLPKGQPRPDGGAVFVRQPLALMDFRIVNYRAGCATKPQVALLMWFELEGWAFQVANTHLTWDCPDTKLSDKIGFAQAKELLRYIRRVETCIVCDDFNAEPESDVLRLFYEAGFVDAHPSRVKTCAPESRAKKIDYLLHGAQFEVKPLPTTEVLNDSPLPSSVEPSDHVPLSAIFSPSLKE